MSKQGKNQDFFDKAKGFLASFEQVLAEGFFESFHVEVSGLENLGTSFVTLRAQAFLPDSKKDMAPGVTSFIDPMKVIESIRQQLRNNKFTLRSSSCEVKTTDWLKFEMVKGEEVMTGRRGARLSFNLAVFFNLPD